jgi:SAM-dependent MidA family methyltransferase
MRELLKRHISKNGPLTVEDFLALVLYHPEQGYYANVENQVIGGTGDFITAPEISQLFGETLALWFVQCWIDMGSPDTPICLIELGPGRGTMIADMVRVFHKFPNFKKNLKIHLVETSGALTQLQRNSLSAVEKALGQPIQFQHVKTLREVATSTAVTFIVANEYFDALPIQQYVIDAKNQKRIRTVGYDAASDGFFFEGGGDAIIEECPKMLADAKIINRLMASKKGAALIVDYGYLNTPHTSTLQAVYRHQKVDVLDNLGRADLSHHVDFAALKAAFGPLESKIQNQAEFLIENGILQRLESLVRKNPQLANSLTAGVSRLIGKSMMGGLFKVLSYKNL